MLKARTASTPINMPDVTSRRRKSILKTPHMLSSSLDSDTPASSPECLTSARRMSHVRFRDEQEDCSEHLHFCKQSNMSKSCDDVTHTRRMSLTCRCNVSSASLNDVLFSVPMLRITATMSPEARYAALKTFEDNLCERLEPHFPDVAHDLTRCRTPDDDADLEAPLPDAARVSHRLQRAIERVCEFRRSHVREKRASSASDCSSCDKMSVKAKLFEEWCDSLRATLDDVLRFK